jgi:hypothetical protein
MKYMFICINSHLYLNIRNIYGYLFIYIYIHKNRKCSRYYRSIRRANNNYCCHEFHRVCIDISSCLIRSWYCCWVSRWIEGRCHLTPINSSYFPLISWAGCRRNFHRLIHGTFYIYSIFVNHRLQIDIKHQFYAMQASNDHYSIKNFLEICI